MKEKDEAKQELEGLSPFLAKIKSAQEQPFEVPKDYFKTLEEDLLSQIPQIDQQKSIPTLSKRNWIDWLIHSILPPPQLAFGVVVLLAVIVVGVFWLNQERELESLPLADVEEALPLDYFEIEQYVVDHIDEFDTELLIEVLEGEEASFLSTETFEAEDVEALYEELLEEVDLPDLESVF